MLGRGVRWSFLNNKNVLKKLNLKKTLLANFGFIYLLILLAHFIYHGGTPLFLLHISSSWVTLSLNTEFEFPMLPLSCPKVCGVGGVEIHFSVKLCSSWTIVKNSLLLDPFFWPNVQWILWNQVCKHDQLFNSLTLLASVLNCTPIKISDFRLKPQQLLMNISWNRVVVERRNVLRRYGKFGYKKQHNWHWVPLG